MLMKAVKNLNGFFVSLYKFFGFGLLLVIVGGMFFYLATTGFFFINHRWMVPSILTPDNEKVLQIKINYLNELHNFKKLESEKLSIEQEIEYIHYAVNLHETFRSNYLKAVEFENVSDKKYLTELDGVLKQYQQVSKTSEKRRENYGQVVGKSLESQFASRLIDKNQFLSGQYMLSQLDLSRLSSKEKLSQLEREREILKEKIDSISESKHVDDEIGLKPRKAANFDVLLKEQQLLHALMSKAELQSRLEPLKLRLESLGLMLDEYQAVLKNMEASPYIRASKEQVNVAFVPYDNLPKMKPGEPIYGCYLEFILCTQVGSVSSVIPGETVSHHPLSGRDIRGQMIEITLTKQPWGESRALVATRPPLLL